MIESDLDYNNFCNETKDGSLILSIIPIDDQSIHPAVSHPTAALIYDLNSKKIYSFSFEHPDCPYHVSLYKFIHHIKTAKRLWTFDKKFIYNLVELTDCLDINLYTHLKDNSIFEIETYETFAHKLIRRNNPNQSYLNNVIPLIKHKESFVKMCEEVTSKFDLSEKLDNGFLKENFIIFDTLAKLEKTGIHVNRECFKNHFEARIYNISSLVYSQYNVYTSTGRPSNRFDGVNYAALNKNDGSRKCFTSRFGDEGKMVLIDYSAFHPRIISYLIKFPISIDTDIYTYLGELYFNRKVTEYDMDEIKSITMRQFYGGIEEKYKHIKYLAHANDFKERYWNDFQENGFIKTPLFERIITNKHLTEANPNKLFNYILQATETEIAISVLREVINYLSSYKTKAVLYTYDSILFDFYKPEGNELLERIMKIMKMGNRFPIKIYEGVSYDEVVQISV